MKKLLLSFTLASAITLPLSAQTTYVLPTTTGGWNWTSTALGGTGWADNSSATGSIADLRGWNGGSAAATITSSEQRQAYQLIMDQADAGGRRVLGGGNAASSLLLGAGGIINAATSGTTVDVRTQVTIGANQTWEAGLGATQTLIMDFRPSSTDATKLNLGGNNLTIGDRVSLQFSLGNTVTSPYAFIGSGSGGTITASGSGNTGVIGIGSQELANNETFDLTGATLAVTSANTAGVTFGRGGQTGTLIKIDGLSGTSALSTNRGGFSFTTSASAATTTTVQLVGSGNYTVDARIRDSATPFAGSALLIQQTGSGNQTFAGSGTAATGGASWSSTAALQVDNGTFIISGDKNGTGAMSVGTAGTLGTLIINGTAAGVVTVGLNGTLGGNGTLSGAVTSSGASAVFAPGNSAGKLNLGSSLDLAAGGTFKMELGSAATAGITYDQLAINGQLTGSTASNGISFEFTDLSGFQTGTAYTLLTFASSTGLDYSDLNATVLPGGYTLDSSFGTGGWLINGTNLQAQFAVIPEPTTWALLAGGLTALVIFRRRRQA